MKQDRKSSELNEQVLQSKEYWEAFDFDIENKSGLKYDFFSVDEYMKKSISFSINSTLNEKLTLISKKSDLLEYIIFFAALNVELYKYTGKQEAIVGFPIYIANKENKDIIKNKVLPLQNSINNEMEIKDLMKKLHEKVLKSYENQYYDIENVLRNSQKYDNIMNLTPINIVSNRLHSSKNIEYICNSNKNEITICINKGDNEAIDISFIYNSKLFKRETIELFGENYFKIINQIVNKLDKRVKDIDMLTEEERNQILYDFNDTKMSYPKDKTIQELFEDQVEKTPDNIAVVFENTQLTYKELNEKSNQLARVLRNKGVQADSIVGIMVEKSLEMIIGIMGILKSGGAYLPIDINYPKERIEFMLKDSESSILLTTKSIQNDIAFQGEIIDLFNEDLFEGNSSNINKINKSTDLAYVIYTSGTTGISKGVMIEHKSLINLCKYHNKELDITENDRSTIYASFSFDACVWETWPYLIIGASIYIVNNDLRFNVEKLNEYLNTNNITISFLPTQMCEKFIEIENNSLRFLLTGGDKLNCFNKKRYQLINNYGPTEATVVTTRYLLEKESNNIPIGKPINNAKVYILNTQNKLLPVGVAGELCIAGDALARGYLNRPELTAQKFIENPFEPGQRMYKTGDLARWLPDGNIEFLGRIDNQVKIRGFRIELGEIENRLLSHENIKEAVVLAKENDNNEKYLCAYTVCEYETDNIEFRNYLKESLPEYMIPSYFVNMERLPVTVNGKINKKALPEPNINELIASKYEAPRNKIEEKLIEIWCEVLGAKKIGINDNFFDLGGDSIKAIRITSKLQKYGYKLEVRELFNHGSIKEVSSYVTSNKSDIDQEIVTGEVKLTPIQKMFFDKNFKDMHHWNQSVMLYNKQGFNEEIIKKVFNEIVNHHDALRMIYKKQNNKVIQINRGIGTEAFDFKVFNYNSYEDYTQIIDEKCNELQSSINLEDGPLVKLGLFKTREGDHLLIAIHHLVIDGVSWRILFEDFSIGYKQAVSGEKIVFQQKTNSFKDWANYLYEQIENDKLQDELKYWENIENQKIKKLPVDRENTEYNNKLKYCNNVNIELSKEETEDLLKNTNSAYNTEINDVLLTALALSIKEWTSEKDILINLEGHGREKLDGDIENDRTIGWFTTKYPLFLSIENSENTGYVLKSVKETLRHVPNKGIGYGILKYMGEKKILNDNEPEISFNYLGDFDDEVSEEIFEISSLSAGESMSLEGERINEVDINGMIANNRLGITITYNSQRYKESTIVKVAEFYKKNLLNIISHCKNKNLVELTPSDFSDNNLTLTELEHLKEDYEKKNNLIIKDIYSLTPMQEGMLFHSLVDEKSTAYFEQTSYTLKGELDVHIMENSFNKLLERYDILRTIIVHDNLKEPKQIVIKERKASIYYKDLTELKKESINECIANFEVEDRKKGFKLNEDILIRLSVLKIDIDEYKIIWSSHHILMDGWCRAIFIKDFFNIYFMVRDNKPVNLKEPTQYVKYIKWLQNQNKNKAKIYWKKYIEDYDTAAVLPTINPEQDKEYLSKENRFSIERRLTEGLYKLSKDKQVTINIVVQAVWGIILQKYNKTEDIVFGSVVSGRNAEVENIEEMVGLFINTIPVRVKSNKNTSFVDLLKEMQQNSLEANKYDYYPLSEIQALSEVKQKLINNIMLFQNFYIDENIKSLDLNNESDLNIIEASSYEQTNYNFNIRVIPDDELKIQFSYNQNVFDSKLVDNIKKHFIKIIETIIDDNEVKLSEIEVITEEEKQQILNNFNQTKMDYQKEKTIHELFEKQVEETPDNIAVIFEDTQLTYRELNKKSNQLARVLRNKGIGSDCIVGIMMDRSIEMIIGIMGILKAGGAYLPIDAKYPKDRIEYMLNDSNVGTIITFTEGAKNLKFSGNIIELKDDKIWGEDDSNLDLINSCNDLAYVIYTSGSTGNPKGVMVEHRQVNNFSQGITKETDLRKHKSILCITTISFDIFGLETLVPLMQGLSIVVASEEQHIDGDKLGELVEKSNLDVMQLTPTRLNMLLGSSKFKSALTRVKTIIVGGEELLPNIIEDLKDYKELEIFNVYGPTETTIWSTIKLLQKEEKITIGKPISNTQIYILSKNNKLEPIGVPGELCIGGDGLARGYLNRPELTAEKFINNPFDTEEKIYKTGDLARWLPDGNIEFLGRMDNQVKIRGFRIELGEIENRLISHENINEAVVLARDNNKYLCGYIVSDKKLNTREIKEYMKETLPEYMVPAHLIQIDEMPLTLNGKINRKALLNIEVINDSENKILPRSLQENLIAEIWKEILEVNEVYIYDDFFEIGGNSINIIQIANEITNRLNVEVSPADLMTNTTVAELSEHIIKNDSCNKYKHIFKINNSSSDKKIFILHGGDADIFYYRHLAKLLENEYSVYGIQPKGLNSRETLPESYYEMLRDYIREIRLIQSEGPYIIAGYCVGGYLAFDIASILEMQGEKVGALIEIDQEPFVEKKFYWKVGIFRSILRGVDFYRRVTRKDKSYTLEKFTNIMEKKYKISKERQMEIISERKNIFSFFCMELIVNCNYCFLAKKVKTPTLVVKAKENHNKLFEDESWENMTEKDLEFYEIEGDHKTLLLPPYVNKLGEIILDYLSRTIGD